jgi:putative heme-binding domain-containing protein
VRRHAVRLADTIAVSDELTGALVRLADDSSIEVRYQLAFTLGAWDGKQKVEALAKIAVQDPANRWVTAAVLNAVGKDAAPLKAMLMGEFPELCHLLDEQIATRSRVADSADNTSTRGGPLPMAIRSADAIASRQGIAASYQGALTMPVNLERGREQFKKHCSGCHRVDGAGFEIGPNLATIKSRGAETVLTAVLDPNREVNPQYLNYSIVTVDGRVLTGTIVDEGATSVTLRRAENVTESVLRIEIDEIKNTGLSMMPEGFEDSIDRQAMADLIGYLMQTP